MSSDIKYKEFIEAACTVAAVLADRIWNATNAPAEVIRPTNQERAALPSNAAAKYVGFGRTKFLELVKAGEIPRPIKRGGKSLWLTKDLDRWLLTKPKRVTNGISHHQT